MAITTHEMVAGYTALLKSMVYGAEGGETRASQSSDDTITLGYGYTFRKNTAGKWGRYVHLDQDLAALGPDFGLTQQESDWINSIVSDLNSGNLQHAGDLRAQFINSWPQNHPDLTPTQMDTLFDVEVGHQTTLVRDQFVKYLGSAATADALLASLAGTREMAAIMTMSYVAVSLVGPSLVKALSDKYVFCDAHSDRTGSHR